MKKRKPSKSKLKKLYAKAKKAAKRVAKDVKGTYKEFAAGNTKKNIKSLLAKKVIKKNYKGLGAEAVKNSRKRKQMLKDAGKY